MPKRIKKYLLKRYLPIYNSRSSFFRIRILYFVYTFNSRVFLKQHILVHALLWYNPGATSVVNTERDGLSVFTIYPISHRHSLTIKVSIILYPACLPTLTLSYPTHGKLSTQPIPPIYIPPHPILAKPTSHYSYTLIVPYPTITVEVNKQKKNEITIQIRPKWHRERNDLGRNDTGPKWLSADHNLWAWSVFSFTIYINFYKTSHRMIIIIIISLFKEDNILSNTITYLTYGPL